MATSPLELLHTLPSPTGPIRAWQSHAHPSPSVPLLATASSDKSVLIYSLTTFALLSTIAGGHKRSVRTVAWKDYTSRKQNAALVLASGSFDANVGVWRHNPTQDVADDVDEEEWNFTTLLTGPDSEVKSVAFCPPHYSANLLATSSRDKSVWVWEEVEQDEWETIAVLSEHTGDVKCVAWADDREVLASGAYDDTIRLWRDVEEEGDWGCVGVLIGHGETVWGVCWEKTTLMGQEARLVSCSDDLTVRIWRRVIPESERQRQQEREERNTPGQRKLPSIIRPLSSMEVWEEESTLPDVHVRSVYAVDWSKKTGLVVSCGGDGVVAVYKEVKDSSPINGEKYTDGDTEMENGLHESSAPRKSEWEIVAVVEGAHDEYEVNHVCWAERRDKDKRWEGEEMIVSTGDDGDVKIWILPRALVEEGQPRNNEG